MTACKNLVVGLDGSPASIGALRWAAAHVDRPEDLAVVHAGAIDPAVPPDIEVGSIHSRDLPPADALLQTAAERGADAIVVGPHGSGLGRGLGSVTRHLLNESEVPVIVVERPDPPRSVGKHPPVIACVGYGDAAIAAATWAADYATENGLPLVLLHAVAYRPIFPLDSASDVLASYLGSGVSAEWALDELDKMAASLQSGRPTLAITTHVDNASVIRAVRNAGETADLVVLGKRSDDEFLHSLGTPRLRRLVARSDFPVAVVPSD